MTTSFAQDLALALDPALLFRKAWKADPDPWQADLLRSNARQAILNCSRQSGKSTVSSILALHDALYQPGCLDLVLSPSLRQSAELFNKIKIAYFAVSGAAPKQDSAVSFVLPNGSRIVCLPGSEATIRGFSGVTRLIIDEASRLDDTIYMAVRPMLAVTGGSINLLSTPFGKRGFFYKEWAEGGPDWKRIEVPAVQVKRISPQWLAKERLAIGTFFSAQEYDCEFLEASGQMFKEMEISGIFDNDLKPIF